ESRTATTERIQRLKNRFATYRHPGAIYRSRPLSGMIEAAESQRLSSRMRNDEPDSHELEICLEIV
ncbi:1821_t:CDS:2, partial [Ambispora gerdemannii]